MDVLNPLDLIIGPIVFLMLWLGANRTKQKHIDSNPAYQYYSLGLLAKIGGGLAVTFVYLFYYRGGDTIEYYKSSVTLAKMLFYYPNVYFDVLAGNLTYRNFGAFGPVGYPYYWKDPNSYAVIRFTNVFSMLTINSIVATVMLVAWLSYKGVWKLYIVFTDMYPHLRKELAYAILFIPSVSFWGSGILKDTYTFGAACWFTFSFYKIFIKREKIFGNIVAMIIMSYIIISIKPYIFIALIPGCITWLIFNRLQTISNPIIRFLSAPILLLSALLLATGVLSFTSGFLGTYSSVDNIVNKAVVTQQDLKRDYYEGNSFDIGDFDPTLPGMLSKAHLAVIAGLFRPFIWEANNPVMAISGLENLLMLGLFIYLLIKVRPWVFTRMAFSEPLLIFAFSFAIFFAFAIGLTTSNFGSLVRYKIPAMPFFLAALLIIRQKALQPELGKADEKEEQEEDVKALPLSPLPSNIRERHR